MTRVAARRPCPFPRFDYSLTLFRPFGLRSSRKKGKEQVGWQFLTGGVGIGDEIIIMRARALTDCLSWEGPQKKSNIACRRRHTQRGGGGDDGDGEFVHLTRIRAVSRRVFGGLICCLAG